MTKPATGAAAGSSKGRTGKDLSQTISAASDTPLEQLELFDAWDVDGPRPAVKYAIAAANVWDLGDRDYKLLLALALDSYDGVKARPSWDGLAYGTAMTKSRLLRAVQATEKPNGDRPELIARDRPGGRRRTTFWLLFAITEPVALDADVQPVAHAATGSHSPTGRSNRSQQHPHPDADTPCPAPSTQGHREPQGTAPVDADGMALDDRTEAAYTAAVGRECPGCGAVWMRGATPPADLLCAKCRTQRQETA